MVFEGVGAARFAGKTVLQHKRRDPAVAKPFSKGETFVAEAKLRVSAARADDDGRAGRLALVRDIGRDRRVVDVDTVITFHFLRLFGAGFGARGSVRPE